MFQIAGIIIIRENKVIRLLFSTFAEYDVLTNTSITGPSHQVYIQTTHFHIHVLEGGTIDKYGKDLKKEWWWILWWFSASVIGSWNQREPEETRLFTSTQCKIHSKEHKYKSINIVLDITNTIKVWMICSSPPKLLMADYSPAPYLLCMWVYCLVVLSKKDR